MNAPRKSWNEYFMDIAHQVATRATCNRKHVGAVITRGGAILSTGYNGSIHGLPHCSEVGCQIEDNHCTRTIHAEINAIIHAAKFGVSIDDATIYTTCSPCYGCFKAIANVGIKQILYREFYREERVIDLARQLNIVLQQV